MNSMNNPPSPEEIAKNTELLETFSIPDQTEELDFKEFANKTGKALFGDYFLSYNPYNQINESVFDRSEPFNGIKGGTYQQAKIIGDASQEKIIEELGIKPMSLNEWEYLFSKLTLEQLYGNTFFLVKFDDGVLRTIKSCFLNEGGGPYSYTLYFEDMKRERTHQQGSQEDLEARVIFPAN